MFSKKEPQPSRACDCCGSPIGRHGNGYYKGGKAFCDHGCSQSYAEYGNRPVTEWPPAPE